MVSLSCLLPDATRLQLDRWQMNDTATQITLYVTARQSLAHGPVCTYPTRRIHSYYTRTLTDLPWGDIHVKIRLRVRKFVCVNGRCPRQIFTKRLPRLVSP
jgi:transposase